MSMFKQGDIVMCISAPVYASAYYSGLTNGCKYTITELVTHEYLILDNNPIDVWHESRFTFIASAVGTPGQHGLAPTTLGGSQHSQAAQQAQAAMPWPTFNLNDTVIAIEDYMTLVKDTIHTVTHVDPNSNMVSVDNDPTLWLPWRFKPLHVAQTKVSCAHPVIYNASGTRSCRQCGEVLTKTEHKPLEVDCTCVTLLSGHHSGCPYLTSKETMTSPKETT